MEVTASTWVIGSIGLVLILLLAALQLVAVVRPRAQWTIDNVDGGSPDDTDPTAIFAFNQASAWADPFLWASFQSVGSIGMLRRTALAAGVGRAGAVVAGPGESGALEADGSRG